MRGPWRILALAVVAVAASALAIANLDNRTAVNTSACGSAGPSDPSYQVATQTRPDPPKAIGSDVLVTLKRDGQLISGANVCLSVDMVTMPMGYKPSVARQVSPGVYDDQVTFGMGGTYAGTLLVKVAGQPVLVKKLYFQVS